MRTTLLLAAVCGLCLAMPLMPANAQTGDRQADHESLTALRETFTQALNKRDFAGIKPLVTDSMTFISISNEKVSGLDGLNRYWTSLFEGNQSVLKSLTVNPVADGPTVFLSDTVGVCQGTSEDVIEFRAVGRRDLTSAWTAVVVKEGGTWKVSRIHMSANVLKNPVLGAQATASNARTIAIALLAFVLGSFAYYRYTK